MARKNKLDSSFQIIENFFDNLEIKSFTENKFREILDSNRYDWNVPDNKYTRQVLKYLIDRKVLTVNNFSDSANESKPIYSWKTTDEYTVISGLKADSYYAFYSSMFLHQLTLQIPKTIYLNHEHTGLTTSFYENALTQEAIDKAFKNAQRKSSAIYSFNDKRIILTNGKNTGKLGVIRQLNNMQSFEHTDLERTLIDISVRPVYAGGVFEVLEAYKLAKDKLNVQKLAEYLDQLNYIYPYHQVIGFYLEKAGYKKKEITLFETKKDFNFYLTYDMRNKEFSDKWKLYYPKGL